MTSAVSGPIELDVKHRERVVALRIERMASGSLTSFFFSRRALLGRHDGRAVDPRASDQPAHPHASAFGSRFHPNVHPRGGATGFAPLADQPSPARVLCAQRPDAIPPDGGT